MRKADKFKAKSLFTRQQNTAKPTVTGMRFTDILQTTVRLYASPGVKQGKYFDTSASYKYSTETPVALQAVTEAEHIQLVFPEKAYTRAAIVIEKSPWDTEQQLCGQSSQRTVQKMA